MALYGYLKVFRVIGSRGMVIIRARARVFYFYFILFYFFFTFLLFNVACTAWPISRGPYGGKLPLSMSLVFISNSIFHLSLELLTKYGKMRLKVA